MNKKQKLYSNIRDVLDFLQPMLDLCNCHMINFYTCDLWNKFLSAEIQSELLNLSEDELCQLPSGSLVLGQGQSSPLSLFYRKCAALTPAGLGIVTPVVDILEESHLSTTPLELHEFMSQKKEHEVASMSSFVAGLKHKKNVECFVDIGSGKGYLGSFLSLYYKIPILGVEASQLAVHGSNTRLEKLQKCFPGLMLRSNVRSAGHECWRRGKKKKYQKPEGTFCKTRDDADICVPPVYRTIQASITTESDIMPLLQENFSDCYSSIGIAGLHTCGVLASNILKIFTSCDPAKVLCNVGCCWHKMEEKFAANPFHDSHVTVHKDEIGFPLSALLCQFQFGLGRNALMLASQSPMRMANSKQMPQKSLFYRALLEVMLQDHGIALTVHDTVGRLSGKVTIFHDYVDKAFQKLGISLKLSDDCIQSYLDKWQKEERKLYCFLQYRATLAPVIEGLVLMDRLAYLLEQDCILDAHLVKLFDPVTSPRCYAIVAFKY